MREIFRYLKPHVPKMLVGFLFKFTGTLVELFIPMILSYIIDDVVPTGNITLVYWWGGAMLLCAVMALINNIVANRMASAVAREATRSIRHDLFSKISYLSSRQIDDFSIPSLESRLTTDTYNVNQVIGMMQRLGVRAPILLVGGIFVTMAMEPILTLVMIAIMPFIGVVVWLVTRKGVPMYTYLQRGIDIMVRTVRENISGIRVIKALSRTEQEKEHFAHVNQEVVNRETRASITMGITNPMMNLFLNTGLTLVVVVGAFRVNSGVTKVGAIIAFLSYFTIILNAMLSITRLFVMYSRGSASASRICEVLYTREDLKVAQAPAVSEEAHVVFDDVSFSYQKKGDDISHISFTLKKGETLGIIGGTGSGKSTIAALLMRLYERDSGSIRISGRPVESIPPEELHTKFGVVFQNDVLFADTIASNIDFGRNLPQERIVQAARCAQAMEFIEGLPDGLQHMLTPRGTNLSGGQKQRVLLARALAGYSEILILDDSSSALDYRTDASLRQALREEYSDVTTIVIAQRVSSILHANHILVLEDGKALGYGTHEELMETCPLYREISESQMGGDFD